jgi:hypothetical protein
LTIIGKFLKLGSRLISNFRISGKNTQKVSEKNMFSNYLTLRSALNNPQNNEMKYCDNMKLKIIVIITSYTLIISLLIPQYYNR